MLVWQKYQHPGETLQLHRTKTECMWRPGFWINYSSLRQAAIFERNWKNQICWLEYSEPYNFLIIEGIQRNVCTESVQYLPHNKCSRTSTQLWLLWSTTGPYFSFWSSFCFPPLPVSPWPQIVPASLHFPNMLCTFISLQMLFLLFDLAFPSYLLNSYSYLQAHHQ